VPSSTDKASAELKFKGLRLFSVSSVLVVAIGAALLAMFQYQTAVDRHIESVERKNILVAQSIRTVLWHQFRMTSSMDDQTAAAQQDHPSQTTDANSHDNHQQLGLPADIGGLLQPLLTRSAVKKFKIYNIDGITLYSTRPEEIGQSHGWSPGLQQAKTGRPHSVVLTNEESHELLDRESEYVETYFPLFAYPASEIIGVFEIYADVGQELTAIRMRQKKEAGALALVILLMFALVAFVNRAISKHDLARAQQLIHLATHDSVTDLPNGALIRDQLEEAIFHAKHLGRVVAVLLIDLDRFQLINDNLGHDTGDEVIKVIANRLSAIATQKDIVGRFVGEFIMILPELETMDKVGTTINRIMQDIKKPVSIEGQTLIVSCTIGVSLYPRDAWDVESLLKCADITRQQAKTMGGNTCLYYDGKMKAGLAKKMNMSSALQGALEREEFLLHYQPQFDLRTGELIAAEALLRWQRGDQGLVPPNEFIPLAEDIGLIGPIGEWVLHTACAQANAWHMAGLLKIRVAVNLSARQMDLQDLARTTETVLAESGLEPQYLELELTEGLIMQNPERAIATFNRIKDIGVGLAIDDFGTGYSSMNYLKRFPLDRLKLDQSFMRGVMDNPEDKVIALTIISMAHHLRFRVIAEGVETKEQLRFLRKHGCDEVQGYYCGRPIPAVEFSHLLHEDSRLPGYEETKQTDDTDDPDDSVRLIRSLG
jgi:diguanylate cyclase (GGDEF)-like protein